jgi:iron complex outermembrane receptor protein
MKNALLTSLIFLIPLIQSLAKEGGEIRGRVLEPGKKPGFACTVQLLGAKDSSFVKGDLTDMDGKFAFTGVGAGGYLLLVSRVDLGRRYISIPALSIGQVLDLGNVSMEETAKELKEVVVRAKRPVIQRIEDRLVFNVSELTTAVGSSAYEMLRKAPGVVVDRESQIMLNGRMGVRIQINGKSTPLSVAELAIYLKSLPASDIEAIEIIENPGSRHEASGKGGIINIVLKKDRNLGTNGSSNASVSFGRMYPKIEAGSRFNHREKKYNVFAGYTNNTNRNWSYSNFERTQNETIYNQKNQDRDRNQGQYYRAGFDWIPNSRQTLGILVSGGYSEREGNSTSETRIINASTGDWYENLTASNTGRNYRNNVNTNLNYMFRDTSGRQVNVDLDYGIYDNNALTYQPNLYSNRQGNILRESIFGNHTPSSIRIRTAKLDYEQKLLGGKFGTGGKVAWVTTDNRFDFFNYPEGRPVLDPERSNHFVYTENVNAGYVNYSRKLGKKFSFQAGVRVEQTRSEGDLESTIPTKDQNVKRNYTNVFPSGSLNFDQNSYVSWGLSYSRRIDRPNYQDLNPFEYKIDELTYRKGNPFLQPQFSHNLSLSNTLFSMLNQSLSYSFTRDFFGQITDTTEKTRAYITQKNIASQEVYGYNISSPLQFAKWWTGYGNVGGNLLRYRADFGEGKIIRLDVYTFNANLQQNFELKKWLTLELSGFYNSPSVWGGTFRNRRYWSVDAGFRMKFFGGNLSAYLICTDLFWSQKWKGINQFGGLSTIADGGYESRQLRLGFVYRFGNNNVAASRNRKTGATQESGRVGS